MQHLSTCFSALFVIGALALAGCAEQPGDTDRDTTAAADTMVEAFTFSGDFDGPLGLQLYSIRDSLQNDVSGTLAWVRDQGFQEVELAGTYGLTPERFRQELDNAGLRATSMHTGYERFRDSTQVVLDEAEIFGVDYVGIAWIPHDERFTVEQAREAAADFNEMGQAASERGLQFFYHNHGYEYRPADDGTIPFDVLVQETDPEYVKFEIDVFWTALPGIDPAAHLREHPERWVLMHIKDMREGISTDDHSGGAPAEAKVPVGTGQIDYQAVLAAAQEIGLERYYIEDESRAPMENIPQSIDFLEQVTY